MFVSRLAILLIIPAPILAQPESRPELTTTIEIPLDRGRLSLLRLSRNVLAEYGLDPSNLHFRDFALPVTGTRGALTRLALNRALGRAVEVTVDETNQAVTIEIDRVAVRALRQATKRRFGAFASSVLGVDILAREYELDVPKLVPLNRPYVLCVHGVDSSPRCFDKLRAYLERQDPSFPTGSFAYANDEAVDRIANQLATRLATLAIREPDRRIHLVSHSMGGIVCRYMLETPGLDPGNVDLLVMLGTPNQGSRLSLLRSGNDIRTLLHELGSRPRILRTLVDGLGEAGWDMAPNSPLLVTLNARSRNPDVDYRLLLGNRGMIDQEDLDQLRERLCERAQGLYRIKLADWIQGLQEVVEGKGDGAVSVARGRLDGVAEVVQPLRHNGLLRDPRALEQVANWLNTARARTK